MSGADNKNKEDLLKVKNDAIELLNDQDKFDEKFEEVFVKYDKNKDGKINFAEYGAFVDDFFEAMGRKKPSHNVDETLFNKADKDRSGAIDKEEFKVDFKKRMNRLAGLKV